MPYCRKSRRKILDEGPVTANLLDQTDWTDQLRYSDRFLDVLGRWQRGWKQDPVLRGEIAANLLNEVAQLPDYVRKHDGTPLFRKRNLYRSKYKGELFPLFLKGCLDEGSPTSWSTSEVFAEEFGRVFDDSDPNSVAGAVFRHTPTDKEVILNIPRLWHDQDFVEAAESYRRKKGREAEAIFFFRDERDQFEVILRAPLRADEIYRLGGSTTYESLYAAAGSQTDEAKAALDRQLSSNGIDPLKARYLSPEGTCRVVGRVIEKQKAKIESWIKKRTPSRPHKCRARLYDAFLLGQTEAEPQARFMGWRRLRGRGGLIEGRWSDGTVVYHGLSGQIWLG
jgi:hypothetical protein